MHTNDILWAASGLSNRVHVLIGSISRQDCTLLTHSIQLREDFFLQIQVFKHRFNHQIDVGDVRIVCGAANKTDELFHPVFRQFALLHGDRVVLTNYAKATL